MDIQVNGPKIWDLCLDLAGIADKAVHWSRQAEETAAFYRLKHMHKHITFHCSCECIAYCALIQTELLDQITQAKMETKSKQYVSLCRTHPHNALDIVNAQRANRGLAPIDDQDDDCDIVYCLGEAAPTATSSDGKAKPTRLRMPHSHADCHHNCYIVTEDDYQSSKKTLHEVLGGKLTQESDMANVVHVHTEGRQRQTCSAAFVEQVLNALASILPCVHCRPHLAVMVRHSHSKPVTFFSDERTLKYSKTKTLTASAADLEEQDAFAPLRHKAKEIRDELEGMEDIGVHDSTTLFREYVAGMAPSTKRIVDMKNAVNERRAAIGVRPGSLPTFHWATTWQRALNYDGLSDCTQWWHIILSFSLAIHDDASNDTGVEHPATLRQLVKDRQEWIDETRLKLKKMRTLSNETFTKKPWLGTLNAFDEAILAEEHDERWMLYEQARSRPRAFVSLLEAIVIISSQSSDAKCANMGQFIYFLPRRVANNREARTKWFIEQRWVWFKETGQDTMRLVSETYLRGNTYPFPDAALPFSRGLKQYTEWMEEGYSEARFEQYVDDTFTMLCVINRDL